MSTPSACTHKNAHPAYRHTHTHTHTKSCAHTPMMTRIAVCFFYVLVKQLYRSCIPVLRTCSSLKTRIHISMPLLTMHVHSQVIYSTTLPRLPAYPTAPWPTKLVVVGSGFNFPLSQYQCSVTLNGQTRTTSASATNTPQQLVCPSPVFTLGTAAGAATVKVLRNNVALPSLTSNGADVTVDMFPVFLGISSCVPAQGSTCTTRGGPASGGHRLVLSGKNLVASRQHRLRFTAGSDTMDATVSDLSAGGVVVSLPPWPHLAANTTVTLMQQQAGIWEEVAASDTFWFRFTQALSGVGTPQTPSTCASQGICWPRTIQITGGAFDMTGPTQRYNFGAAIAVGHSNYSCKLISSLGDGDLIADYVILDSGSSMRCVLGSSGNAIAFSAQTYTVQVNYSGTPVPFTPAANKMVALTSAWDIVTIGSCYVTPCPTSAPGGAVLELRGHGFKLGNRNMTCAFRYNGALSAAVAAAQVASKSLVSFLLSKSCEQCLALGHAFLSVFLCMEFSHTKPHVQETSPMRCMLQQVITLRRHPDKHMHTLHLRIQQPRENS
jgi:hypothetical protein